MKGKVKKKKMYVYFTRNEQCADGKRKKYMGILHENEVKCLSENSKM